jgi:hypothetical protein
MPFEEAHGQISKKNTAMLHCFYDIWGLISQNKAALGQLRQGKRTSESDISHE